MNIRFVDLDTQTEQILCSLPTIDRQALKYTVVRLDGHPAWNRDYTQVCFQAAPEGMRQLFIADVCGIVSS